MLNNEWVDNEIMENNLIYSQDTLRKNDNNLKPMGHREGSSTRKIHSNTDLPQETRKFSNKQSNLNT